MRARVQCIEKPKLKLQTLYYVAQHLPDVFPEAIFATRSTPPPITKSLMRLLELKGFSCSSNCFCFCFRCNWCCWCCRINRSRSWKCEANAMRSCSTADDMIALAAVISAVFVVGTPLATDESASNLLCCCWRSSSLNGMLLFICFGLLCVDCVVIDDEDDKAVTGRCHCISTNINNWKKKRKFFVHSNFHKANTVRFFSSPPTIKCCAHKDRNINKQQQQQKKLKKKEEDKDDVNKWRGNRSWRECHYFINM